MQNHGMTLTMSSMPIVMRCGPPSPSLSLSSPDISTFRRTPGVVSGIDRQARVEIAPETVSLAVRP